VVAFLATLPVLQAASFAVEPEGPMTVEDAARNLGSQILESMTPAQPGTRRKVAVLEFADLKGSVTNQGRLVAEELLTNLYASGRFSIVERLHLKKILEEKGLAAQGLTAGGPDALRELARVTGADAIVTGSLSEGPGTVTAVARVIATGDGVILGMARADILKEDDPTRGAMSRRAPLTIDQAATSVAESFAGAAPSGAGQKQMMVAVLPFTHLEGGTPDEGKQFAEELTVGLFNTRHYRVVERTYLEKLLVDHQLARDGIIDPGSVARLGELAQADAIVTGTLAEIGNRIRVNARIISTRTGDIFAAASASFALRQRETSDVVATEDLPPPPSQQNRDAVDRQVAGARAALASARYAEAIRQGKQALAKDPKNPEALSVLAEANFLAGSFDEFSSYATATLDAGGSVSFPFKHPHKVLGTAHPVTFALTSRGLTFDPQTGKGGDCTIGRFSASLQDVVSADVSKNKYGEVVLEVEIRDSKNSKKTRELTLADPAVRFTAANKSLGGVFNYAGKVMVPGKHASEELDAAARFIDWAVKASTVVASANLSQGAGGLISKIIAAAGGLETLRSVRDMVSTGTTVLHGASQQTLPMTFYWSAPNRFRVDLVTNRGIQTYGFDGRRGWFKDADGALKELTEDVQGQLRADSKTNGPSFYGNLLREGIEASVTGVAKEEGHVCHVIALSDGDGDTVQYYVDSTTYLPMKCSVSFMVQKNKVSAETVIRSYRDVAGLRMPSNVDIYLNGRLSETTTLTSISVNQHLDGSLFDKPAR